MHIISVRFKDGGDRTYDYKTPLELAPGDQVVVTARGNISLATVEAVDVESSFPVEKLAFAFQKVDLQALADMKAGVYGA